VLRNLKLRITIFAEKIFTQPLPDIWYGLGFPRKPTFPTISGLPAQSLITQFQSHMRRGVVVTR